MRIKSYIIYKFILYQPPFWNISRSNYYYINYVFRVFFIPYHLPSNFQDNPLGFRRSCSRLFSRLGIHNFFWLGPITAPFPRTNQLMFRLICQREIYAFVFYSIIFGQLQSKSTSDLNLFLKIFKRILFKKKKQLGHRRQVPWSPRVPLVARKTPGRQVPWSSGALFIESRGHRGDLLLLFLFRLGDR